MAELADILASGDIPKIDAQELDEAGVPLELVILAAYSDGIGLPQIPAANAETNSIFYNTDIDRVCWKSNGGLVFKFNMQLI